MITIQLNGEPLELAEGTSITAIIEQRGLAGRRVAVELNREIVPRSEHATQTVADGDQVEIVTAIGGGQG